MEALAIITAIALGYSLARCVQLLVLYHHDKLVHKVIKRYDESFLRSVHIDPEEEPSEHNKN